MVRVAFDGRLLLHDQHPSGVWHYAHEIVQALSGVADIHLLVDNQPVDSHLPGRVVYIPRKWAWQQLHLPRALNRLQPIVFHSFHSTLPLMTRVPSIVTIHDLAFWHMPEVVERDARAYLRRWVPPSLRRAAHIITPSEYVRRELLATFHIDSACVTAIHHGVGAPFSSVREPGEVSPCPWQYVLAVCTLEPRKNLTRLIRAFADLARSYQSIPHHLVLVGRPTTAVESIRSAIIETKLEDRVHLAGYLARKELARYYRHASLFAFPSLYEGFGMPLLEAMASGCPVLAGNSGGMAEIVDDAGILVRPTETEDIAAGLYRGLTGDMTKASEVAKARAGTFTWTRAAQHTLQIYKQALL